MGEQDLAQHRERHENQHRDEPQQHAPRELQAADECDSRGRARREVHLKPGQRIEIEVSQTQCKRGERHDACRKQQREGERRVSPGSGRALDPLPAERTQEWNLQNEERRMHARGESERYARKSGSKARIGPL